MFDLPANSGAGALTPSSNGVWASVANPVLLGSLARSDFDWIALDAQHGEFDRRAIIDAGRVLAGSGHAFAVRVGSVSAAEIGLALDAGAATVIVPQVDSVDEARLSVAAAHYPPRGNRSWGPLAPLVGLPAPLAADASPQVAVMIESATALANIAQIAAVPGIDLLFVGPFDLALSLGVPLDDLLADTDGPLRTIREAAEAHGLGVAAFAGSPERAGLLRNLGFDRIAVTTDTAVISAGAHALLASSRLS
jgi:4-hydroxy-2-oxoheptanedioate aldolase